MALTAEEEEKYDRQLRLWGLKAQQNLKNSKVLVCGLGGVHVEVVKNIVLAGANVLLADAATASRGDLEVNFFLREEDVGQPVALSARPRVQAMNALCSVEVVEVDTADPRGLAASAQRMGAQVVCVALPLPAGALPALNAALREQGVGLVVSATQAESAFFWQDLGLWRVEEFTPPRTAKPDAAPREPETVEFRPLVDALAAPLPRRSDPLLPAYLALLKGEGAVEPPLAPTAAVVGGLLAQELIKVVTRRDVPLYNTVVVNGALMSASVAALPARESRAVAAADVIDL